LALFTFWGSHCIVPTIRLCWQLKIYEDCQNYLFIDNHLSLRKLSDPSSLSLIDNSFISNQTRYPIIANLNPHFRKATDLPGDSHTVCLVTSLCYLAQPGSRLTIPAVLLRRRDIYPREITPAGSTTSLDVRRGMASTN